MRSNGPLLEIFFGVLALHMTALFLLSFSVKSDVAVRKSEKLAVRFVSLKKEPPPIVGKDKAAANNIAPKQKRNNDLALALAKIGKLGLNSTSEINLPEVAVEEAGEKLAAGESDYFSLLSDCLRKKLRLPEKGFVKIVLTLERGGKVVDLEIVSYEKDRNRSYISAVLPTQRFPSFDGYIQDKVRSFKIVLTGGD